jgi:opacity protein-like surface antigen
MKRILLTAVLAAACAGAFAQQATQTTPAPQNVESAGTRVGLGQDSAREPAKIKNLRLSDPLVQQKYLNEPDMLRFLRGTYSEACARGLVKNAADSIWLDTKNQYTTDQKAVAKQLVESNRIWKMTSFEMEALYGAGYLNAANYCDCIMKEVSDQDLVNPRKGLDAVEQISKPAQTACQQNAKETTERQMAERKKNEKKN